MRYSWYVQFYFYKHRLALYILHSAIGPLILPTSKVPHMYIIAIQILNCFFITK